MIRGLLRLVCGLAVLVGLAYVYTFLYGGPFAPFFSALAAYMPAAFQIRLGPRPLTQ